MQSAFTQIICPTLWIHFRAKQVIPSTGFHARYAGRSRHSLFCTSTPNRSPKQNLNLHSQLNTNSFCFINLSGFWVKAGEVHIPQGNTVKFLVNLLQHRWYLYFSFWLQQMDTRKVHALESLFSWLGRELAYTTVKGIWMNPMILFLPRDARQML